MDFPNGFNTPVFPAGPRIALSRIVAIAIMVVFLLTVGVCGVLLWAQRSVQVHPFLISVNNITGQWQVVGHNHHDVATMTAERSLQESVIGKFVQNWFLVSDNTTINENTWQSCERDTECTFMQGDLTGNDVNKCALYCVAGEEVYADFTQKIVPTYKEMVQNNVTWHVDMPSLQIKQIDTEAENENLWQIRAKIINTSTYNQPIEVLGYAKIGRNTELFPMTMGYFVTEFNAYKMN